VSLAENDYLCSRNPKSTIMTAITINVPNHEVSFFKKMMVKMGWTYSEVATGLRARRGGTAVP